MDPDTSKQRVRLFAYYAFLLLQLVLTDPGEFSDEEVVGGASAYLVAYPKTTCHILTLHEKAEMAERAFGEFAPRGSLLLWVDVFLAEPLTPQQHTSGRFTNTLTPVTVSADRCRA